MGPVTRRPAVMLGVVLVVIAASLLAAYVLATSAAGKHEAAGPIWFSTADRSRARPAP